MSRYLLGAMHLKLEDSKGQVTLPTKPIVSIIVPRIGESINLHDMMDKDQLEKFDEIANVCRIEWHISGTSIVSATLFLDFTQKTSSG